MRIITCNVNGLRSAARKNFFPWLVEQNADVVCLQEVKAQADILTQFTYPGYHLYFHCAEKKGYSGVAIYSRSEPLQVKMGLGWESVDTEGRYVQLDFKHLTLISLYFPSGTSGEHRQVIKYDFMHQFEQRLQKFRQDTRNYIVCGDWNIAHRPIDLKNWRANQKNSGFLPKERAWLDHVLGPLGFVDAFRVINQEPDQYTWWSNRGRAREKNVGWRIDYQIITPGLVDKIQRVAIYKDQWFSDHAPLVIDYDIVLA